jgi:hypothetical protein
LQAFTEQSLGSYLQVTRAGSWPGIFRRVIQIFTPAKFSDHLRRANFAIIFGQEKTPTISDGGFFTLVL